jgi:hypothetical protein
MVSPGAMTGFFTNPPSVQEVKSVNTFYYWFLRPGTGIARPLIALHMKGDI